MTPPTPYKLPNIWVDVIMSDINDLDRFPDRKNPRLKAFDYTSQNYYFVTICAWDKRCLFGSPSALSRQGKIAAECLCEISAHFPEIAVDKWVIMPNHIHAIVILPGNGIALSAVIGQYKAAVAKRIRELYPNVRVWQRSFHDHVIRNQTDYARI